MRIGGEGCQGNTTKELVLRRLRNFVIFSAKLPCVLKEIDYYKILE